MSTKQLRSLTDYARAGFKVRVDCLDCGRKALLDPRQLLAMCSDKGWQRHLHVIERKLRCKGCGKKNVRIGPAFAD